MPAHVIVAARKRALTFQHGFRLARDLHVPVVHLDPALVAFEPDRPRSETAGVVQNEFHAVLVGGRYLAGHRYVVNILRVEVRLAGIVHRTGVVPVQSKLRQVRIVRTHVAHGSTAGIEKVVPTTVSTRVVRMVRRSAQPRIPVQSGGYRRIRHRRGSAIGPGLPVDGMDLPDRTCLHHLLLEPVRADRPALVPALVDGPVAFGCIHHRTPLFDRQRVRFLTVNILARLRRHDRRDRMHAVTGGDDDTIQIVACKDILDLNILSTVRILVMRVDPLLALFSPRFPTVAHSNELHFRESKEPWDQCTAHAPTIPYDRKRQPVTRRYRTVLAQSTTGNNRRHRQRKA